MSNLFRRHITLSDKCELCNLHPEDPLHTVWLCSEVESTWSSFQCFNRATFPRPQSFNDLLANFLQVKQDYRKEVFTITTCLLWNRRNAIHFDRPVLPTAQLVSKAGNLLHDFLAVQEVDSVQPSLPTVQHWRAPESSYHKINFDAATFRNTHSVGLGVVVRDWRGEFVGALLPLCRCPN